MKLSKKNIYISRLIALFLVFNFSACDVLDQEPENQYDQVVAITDRLSSQGALNGLYDALQSLDYYGAYFVTSTDVFTEDLVNAAFWDSYRQINSQYVPTTTENVKFIWLQMYRAINVANYIITYVPQVDDSNFSDEERDEIVAAAEMIRGMVYFDLLRLYGEHWDVNSAYGVPVRTSPAVTPEFVSRSTVAQTYERILTDLENAATKLPDTFNPAYASKQCANALLARVHLYLRDYPEAIAYATEVVESGHFQLQENYLDIYSKKQTTESIFELSFSSQDQSYYLREFAERDEVTIAPEFVTLFDAEDSRGATVVVDVDNPNLLTTEKYKTQDASAFILRLAEMYTIRAEAQVLQSNNITAGLADLNHLRVRAGIVALQESDIPTADVFMEMLLLEKRKEFYAEAHRFFDLARLQKMEDVYGIENFRSIFPIPFVETLTASGAGVVFEQNSGF